MFCQSCISPRKLRALWHLHFLNPPYCCRVGWHSNWRLGNSRDGVPYCCQLWRPPQGWKIVLLPWNFGSSITSMLKTCIPNFKSRGLIKQKILKINHHGVAVRKVSQPPTLTPSQGLRKFFCPWNFWSENTFMLITCVEIFKSKKCTKKITSQIYQHV